MSIILQDKRTGKEIMIAGKGNDFELFKRSNGKKNTGEWITARLYPTSLPHAVDRALRLLLADPDDEAQECAEADKACVALKKIIQKRVDEIVLEAKET